jgi:hypothetical protein
MEIQIKTHTKLLRYTIDNKILNQETIQYN